MRLRDILSEVEFIRLSDALGRNRPPPTVYGIPVIPDEDGEVENRTALYAAMYGLQDDEERQEQAEIAAIQLDLAKAEATRARAALDQARARDIAGGGK